MDSLVRSRSSLGAGAFALAIVAALVPNLVARDASAQPRVIPDRVAVRFIAPETGGPARPRFFTEREIAFFALIEALIEQGLVDGDAYPERYVRVAIDRLVARAILASLLVQRGTEPSDLPKLVLEARAELAERMGAAALDDAMRREGIEDAELEAFLRDQVRGGWYIDRAVAPILAVTEDSLREAYRSSSHPFRTQKYEEARPRLRRWLAVERMRAAELEFLQSARTRVTIATIPAPNAAAQAPAQHTYE